MLAIPPWAMKTATRIYGPQSVSRKVAKRQMQSSAVFFAGGERLHVQATTKVNLAVMACRLVWSQNRLGWPMDFAH